MKENMKDPDAAEHASVTDVTAADAALIAGTVADAVRERIAEYAPVTNGHQAVILAYTLRMFRALERMAAPGVDLREIRSRLDDVVTDAQDAGYWVDETL